MLNLLKNIIGIALSLWEHYCSSIWFIALLENLNGIDLHLIESNLHLFNILSMEKLDKE